MIEMPCTVPIAGGRIGLEAIDTTDKRHGRSITGDRFERAAKSAARIVPLAGTIGGQPLAIELLQ
jgi:hypothetical protein